MSENNEEEEEIYRVKYKKFSPDKVFPNDDEKTYKVGYEDSKQLKSKTKILLNKDEEIYTVPYPASSNFSSSNAHTPDETIYRIPIRATPQPNGRIIVHSIKKSYELINKDTDIIQKPQSFVINKYSKEELKESTAPYSTVGQHIEEIVKILEFKFYKTYWEPSDSKSINEVYDSLLLELKKNPKYKTFSNYSRLVSRDKELLKKIIKATPYVLKDFMIRPHKILNLIHKTQNYAVASVPFKEAIKFFSIYRKIINYDKDTYIERIKICIDKFVNKINEIKPFSFDTTKIEDQAFELYKNILENIQSINNKSAVEIFHKNPFNPSVKQISGALIYIIFLKNKKKIYVDKLKEYLGVPNISKAKEVIYKVIKNNPNFDLSLHPRKKHIDFNDYRIELRRYIKQYSTHLSLITNDKIAISVSDQDQIINLFDDKVSNSNFAFFYDSFNNNLPKSPKHIASVLCHIYITFYRDLNISKDDFRDLLNKQKDFHIADSTMYGLYKIYMENFFIFNTEYYFSRCFYYVIRYVNKIKRSLDVVELKLKFDDDFIKYVKELYNLAVVENKFPIIRKIKYGEKIEQYIYYFPQTMALTLIYIAIRATRELTDFVWNERLESLFSSEYEKETQRKFVYILMPTSNPLHRFIFTKNGLERFKRQSYSYEDFISELERNLDERYHLETKFLLDLFKLTGMKDPAFFCKKLGVHETSVGSSNVGNIIKLVRKRAPFRTVDTFSSIRNFIIHHLHNKSQKIALKMFEDLKYKRTHQNECVWDLLYRELTDKKKKTINLKYIFDELPFLIDSRYNKRQFEKYIQIFLLILNYDLMLNHRQIAKRIAPRFKITTNGLVKEIYCITSYLDKKPSFNRRERFPYVVHAKTVPLISDTLDTRILPLYLDLYRYLIKINNTRGFPDHIIKIIEDPNICTQRISNFSNRMTNLDNNRGIQRLKKKTFIKHEIQSNRLKTLIYNETDLKKDSNLSQLDKFLLNLCYLSKDFHYEKKFIWGGHGSACHEVVLPNILKNIKESLGIETPIWLKSNNDYLLGHIDLIILFEDTVLICDYKPNESPFYSEEFVNTSFLNSIPQVSSYAKVINILFGVNKIRCVIFNKIGLWYYDFNIMKYINKLMINNDLPSYKRPWENYLSFAIIK